MRRGGVGAQEVRDPAVDRKVRYDTWMKYLVSSSKLLPSNELSLTVPDLDCCKLGSRVVTQRKICGTVGTVEKIIPDQLTVKNNSKCKYRYVDSYGSLHRTDPGELSWRHPLQSILFTQNSDDDQIRKKYYSAEAVKGTSPFSDRFRVPSAKLLK